MIKKVLIVLDSFNIGGAERQAIILAAGLRDLGYDVELLALGIEGNGTSFIVEKDLPYGNLNLTLYTHHLSIIKRNNKVLRKVLKEKKPGVVLPFTYWPNLYCNAVKKRAKIPFCVWNQRDLGFNLGSYNDEGNIIQNTDWIIGNSQSAVDVVRKKCGDKIIKSKVVHNGIPNHFLRKEPRAITNHPMTAVMVANIQKNKDHETLIRSWKLLKDRLGSDCPRLKLVGAKRDTYAGLKDLVDSLDLNCVLEFTGMIDNVCSVISKADFSVFSSNSEGSPNGLLECMAARLPVVATDIDSIREALGQNCHFLVPINSPDIFAEKIIALISDKQNMLRVGNLNYEHIVEHFSYDNMIANYVDVIER
ncbi:MAG: glycosyltransferase family 4 protein [Crocinitomicaceae bacterium]|nr:glycosyltransferase family 4 protein [Crocinitomicaceae bacterium]